MEKPSSSTSAFGEGSVSAENDNSNVVKRLVLIPSSELYWQPANGQNTNSRKLYTGRVMLVC